MKLVGKGRVRTGQHCITLTNANCYITKVEWRHWFDRRLEIYAVYESLARSMPMTAFPAPPLTFRVY